MTQPALIPEKPGPWWGPGRDTRFRPSPAVHYPESDGQPMAETDAHRDEMAELIQTLKRHFRHRPDVYVSGNLLIYYEEGNPKARRAPDVFVVLGVTAEQRRTYLLWEEGAAPDVVIEVTSKGTRSEDEKVKPPLYARLGVRFLFLYDPLGEYLDPPLQGKRLGEDGVYRPISAPEGGPFGCPPLGLELLLDEEGRLQFRDPKTGELVVRVPTALDRAEEALEQETQARTRAEQALVEAEQALVEAEQRDRERLAEIERLKALLR